MWNFGARIAEDVSIEQPAPLQRYFGCTQRSLDSAIAEAASLGSNLPGVPNASRPDQMQMVTVMEYDVMAFIGQCLEACESLVEGNFQLYKRALTPTCRRIRFLQSTTIQTECWPRSR